MGSLQLPCTSIKENLLVKLGNLEKHDFLHRLSKHWDGISEPIYPCETVWYFQHLPTTVLQVTLLELDGTTKHTEHIHRVHRVLVPSWSEWYAWYAKPWNHWCLQSSAQLGHAGPIWPYGFCKDFKGSGSLNPGKLGHVKMPVVSKCAGFSPPEIELLSLV